MEESFSPSLNDTDFNLKVESVEKTTGKVTIADADIADLEKKGLHAAEKAQQKSELLRNYAIKSERVHTVNQLLKAYSLFEKEVEYVVMDNKVKIVYDLKQGIWS